MSLSEARFHDLVDAAQQAVEDIFDDSDLDLDLENSAGVLTVRFENGSQQPVSIIVGKNGRPTMAFGNGLRGRSSSYDDLQLLQECSDTIESCQSEKSADFVEVAAGSGIDFNANFRGSDDNVTRDEIKEIVSGTINMRLYVVGPGGFRRTLDVSIPNAPIQNRVQ